MRSGRRDPDTGGGAPVGSLTGQVQCPTVRILLCAII